MLQESRACIITDMKGIKKDLAEKKPSPEKRRKIAKSIANLDSKRLKELYEAK